MKQFTLIKFLALTTALAFLQSCSGGMNSNAANTPTITNSSTDSTTTGTTGATTTGLTGTTTTTTGTGTETTTTTTTSAKPFQAAAQVSGSAQSLSLGINVSFNAADVGQTGTLFVAAKLTNNQIFFLDASANQFVQYTTGTPVAVVTGTIPSSNYFAQVMSQFNTNGLSGTKIFVGYGLGSPDQAFQEMMNSSRFFEVYSLQ